ncbi:uncharacterized protein LW94_2539 [Fusarium fujikuroi]|nr:uncharacterized protein LW94_2539 [Fusarium fujikuroi]
MTVPRSNRAVLLAAVVFVTIFLGLAHFHLKTPSESTAAVKSGVNEPAPFVPEKEAAAAAPTFVPGEDEEIGATPAVEVVAETPKPEEHHHAVTPDKPEADPAEEPSDPEEIAEAEEQAANASPTPAAAASPAAEPEQEQEHDHEHEHEEAHDHEHEHDHENEEEFIPETEVEETPEAPAIPEAPTGPNLDAFTPEQWIKPAVKVNEPEYYPYGHWPSKLPSDKPIWNEPLGKKLCIIDLESRRFDKPGQIWSDEMTWNKSREVHGPSGGTLNHWVYCTSFAYPLPSTRGVLTSQ